MQHVNLADLEVQGLLAYRAILTAARLEGRWYRPWEVFTADAHDWPGDWEGRCILAQTLMAQVLHRTPAWTDDMLRLLPTYFNPKGYLGPVYPDGQVHEQQISGHSWLLRALIEHYYWQKRPEVLAWVETIARNLLLPLRGLYAVYPIQPEDRLDSDVWHLSDVQTKLKTHAATIDTGCAFMMLDGATQAYELLRWPELRELIEEIIARFATIDLVKIQVQTHATLSATRGILRYYALEQRPPLLELAERIFRTYKAEAWTENYANYNWFGRPRWTESCAIVDSFIVAAELWTHARNPLYLEDAHHIYYNAIAEAHRASGGFGSAKCLGTEHVHLESTTYEVHWCCSMRGGEMWHKACQNLLSHADNRIYIPFYHNARATLRLPAGSTTLELRTGYPYDGTVTLRILEAPAAQGPQVRFFAPSWTSQGATVVQVNNRPAPTVFEGGFLALQPPLATGDTVSLDLGIGLHVQPTHNPHSHPGYHTFRHGPCCLWAEDYAEVLRLPRNAQFEHLGMGRYRLINHGIWSGAVLGPIADPSLLTQPGSRKQVLFRQDLP